MERPLVKDVIDRHRDELMDISGVNGVGAGKTDDDPPQTCILVYYGGTDRPAELPEELEGYPVKIEKSSGFRAL